MNLHYPTNEGNTMKIRSMAVVGTLLAAALIPLGVTAASANTGGEVCTPSGAWVEEVEHPAVGEPTITVPNPDYKPAVEEVSHVVNHPAETTTVNHPAETKVVHHEAVTHTEYHFAKYTQERTRERVRGTWGPWSAYGAWTKYSPETHTSWELNTNPIGSPQFHSSGGQGNTQWERQWQARYDGQTRVVTDKAAWDETVVVKEAWTETVVVKEAWDEKIIDVPGQPAVGEPTITKPNPEYEEAWTEEVKHPEVTCPTGPRHNANGEATCGAYSITLYNQQDQGYVNQTASFVVYIDGKFDDAYAVFGGEQQTITGAFPEDSGNHQVIVRTGPAQGDEFVFSLDVTSDCIAPQPEADVVVGEWSKPLITCDSEAGDLVDVTREVTTTEYVLSENGWVPGEAVVTTEDGFYVVTAEDIEALDCAVVVPPVIEPEEPVTPVKPAAKPAPKPVKAAAVSDSTLAQTGGEINPWLIGGGVLALLAGAGIRVARRQH